MKLGSSIIITVLLLSACQNSKKAENQNGEVDHRVVVATEIDQKETFKTIDAAIVKKLNSLITLKNLTTEEEIMNAYAPKSLETEGNYSYIISKNAIGNDSQEITLIEDGLLDDSLAARKIIMVMKRQDSVLQVVSIKENYKCRQGRGHQDWGAKLCN